MNSLIYNYYMLSKVSNFSGPSSVLFSKRPSTSTGWQIIMMYTGKKTDQTSWVGAGFSSLRISMASPGVGAFATASAGVTSSNAISRTNIGDGQGVYLPFFNKTNITKIGFIDGTGTAEPTTNTNYLVYDLVESTGNESLYQILRRLDLFQKTSTNFAANDSVWGTPSTIYHTAGASGYSGLLVATGGTGFRDNRTPPRYPDKFAVLGINRDSDNDIQALAAYSGNLLSGKSDAWRGQNPLETFWSYWGNDFHSSSQTQTLSGSLQSAPGVSLNASWTQSVYLVAFS